MSTFIRHFIQGLLVVVPLAITVWVIYALISWIQGLFSIFGGLIHPAVDPFLYIAMGILAIFLIGMFATNVVATFLIHATETILERTPVVKLIYTPIKDVLSAFIGNRKRFTHPVLITINEENNIREIGFMTQGDLTDMGLGSDLIAVYIPASYAVSGRLLIIPRNQVKPLDIPATEVMKFILSGGVSDID